VKLVACPKCHAQFDVEGIQDRIVTCPCGTTFPAEPPAAKDAAVTRCAACGALVGPTETVCSYCHAEIARRPAPTGPVCPECYARNPENARYCTACGAAFLPQPVRTRILPLECPVCATTHLAARSLGGIWVDECPSCLGLWAPGDVMDRLVDRIREKRRKDGPPPASLAHAERRSEWRSQIQYRHCPECGGVMQRKNFGRRSGVIVDWCGSHGTWLDAHEMEDIAAFVLEGGLESGPAAGGGSSWALPADPNRMAALAAAERLMAEERARTLAAQHPGTGLASWTGVGPGGARGAWPVLRGVGDLLAHLLK
jgi:Zn-finger nucleic acid-binding protein/ribosomal protein L40E